MAPALNMIFSKDDKELSEFGNNARNYIVKEKNSKVQCEKIMSFLRKIDNK